MYKISNDKRFNKNKKALRKAYLDLVVKKGTSNLTVAEITKKADVNRMTFYAHYEVVDDIFDEFIDEMKAEIRYQIGLEKEFSLDRFFEILNELMYQNIDFYCYVAKNDHLLHFRDAFKGAISDLIVVDLKENTYTASQKMVLSDLTAVCISYTYLDYLSGLYGEISLDEVIDLAKKMLRETLDYTHYLRKGR